MDVCIYIYHEWDILTGFSIEVVDQKRIYVFVINKAL